MLADQGTMPRTALLFARKAALLDELPPLLPELPPLPLELPLLPELPPPTELPRLLSAASSPLRSTPCEPDFTPWPCAWACESSALPLSGLPPKVGLTGWYTISDAVAAEPIVAPSAAIAKRKTAA